MTEKELIEQFIKSQHRPGHVLNKSHCAAIEAAKARLERQQKAASKAGASRSKIKSNAARENGRQGGRPPKD